MVTDTVGDASQLSWFRDKVLPELRPQQLIPNLIAGFVVSVIVIIVAVSLATLIFAGELEPFLDRGIGMMLFTGILITGILAVGSSYPGMIGYPQERVAPILALMAVTIEEQLLGTVAAEVVFYTVAAGIIFASLSNGLILLALGYFRLGALIRFIPYPVIGGFLAGTGFLLVKGSLGVMTALHLDTSDLPVLLEGALIVKWLPGVAFGLIMVFVTHHVRHYLVMPSLLLGAIAIFYIVLFAVGQSPAEARSDGWLLGPFPEAENWKPETLAAVSSAQWSAILSQVGNLLTILFITVVSVLLNSGAMELAVKQDIDLDRELKVAGIANTLIAIGGGTVGFHSLSISRLVHRMGAKSRVVGLTACLLCFLMLVFGSGIMNFFPRIVLGGLLFFLGMHFLVEWTYDAWFRLTRADYAIVIMILGFVAVFGYLYGVAAGIVACIVLFLVNCSGVNVVRHALSGAHQQSNVDRPARHFRVLNDRGAQLHVFKLQGYIFFGTANGLLEQVRTRVKDHSQPSLLFLILDFRSVSGIDSSSTISFVKMRQLAEQQAFTLIFSDVGTEIRRQLGREGLADAAEEVFRYFPDLDHGLERCENEILKREGVDPREYDGIAMRDQLGEEFPKSVDLDRLLSYFKRLELEGGHRLIHQGREERDLYLIESGQVTASLDMSSGQKLRLRTMWAGATVGEIGLILGRLRSANVDTEVPTTVYHLSANAIAEMEREDPELAIHFHRFLSSLLAERMANTNHAIEMLLG